MKGGRLAIRLGVDDDPLTANQSAELASHPCLVAVMGRVERARLIVFDLLHDGDLDSYSDSLAGFEEHHHRVADGGSLR